jgi:hypothetical protein
MTLQDFYNFAVIAATKSKDALDFENLTYSKETENIELN